MKEKPQECDWCSSPEEPVPAIVRVTYTTLEGVVLDYAYLCEECQGRGAALKNNCIDAVN